MFEKYKKRAVDVFCSECQFCFSAGPYANCHNSGRLIELPKTPMTRATQARVDMVLCAVKNAENDCKDFKPR